MTSATSADQIREAGFRATKSRVRLVSFLQKRKYPLSIQEIAQGLGKDQIDQVTVYRMVEAFARAGLLREVGAQHNRPHYELQQTGEDHDHIICTNCHRVEDFVGCNSEQLKRTALRQSRSFSTITAHSFNFYGLCNACSKLTIKNN